MRHIVQFFKRALPPALCAALLISGVAAQSPTKSPVPMPVAPLVTESDAVRFLEQATFGPNSQLINRVRSAGIGDVLQGEFSVPMSLYPDLPAFPSDSSIGCPTGSDPNCFRDNYTMFPLQVKFFLNAQYGDDQLRQRVAFALHQIFVVSGLAIQQPSSMVPYLNLFARGAFGNYRQLLYDVTLNPAMGFYLDMANNDKRSGGASPNENYAREILQLFSIGLYTLNQDGTLQLDGLGQPIPTYDQNTIIGFAKIFTGWTYAPLPGAASQWTNPENYLAPMVAFQNHHDVSAKPLLNGVTSPANQTAKKDLVFALNNIFNHPNVAPFICKQLIQNLVTSNPTPGYVSRISAIFNNNGAGVRGDLKAVVSAILLDQEARCDDVATCASTTDVNYGHLRSPVLFITNILRAFNPTSDGVGLSDRARNTGQEPFNPPTVFSYYRPNYVIPGTTLLGPEFTIQSSSAAINRANFANTMVFSRIGTAPAGTAIDLTGLQALSTSDGTGAAVVNELNRLLMHGTMSTAMRTKIMQTIQALPGVTAADHLKRARWALYLVTTSSQYQVAR
ncbi:MAG TPA: DUF1800 domain-containing protein [Blastocatellia bacterium]|nr:DUF1800 domain-containing protein [Blastocatellia bacterium]